LSAVVVAQELSHLPVIVDPSHAAGNGRWVPRLALAALAVGADGLLLEVHPQPESSWSDADQAIDLNECARIVRAAQMHWRSNLQSTADARRAIDSIDTEIVRLLQERRHVSQVMKTSTANAGSGQHDMDPET
jgi:DAHP synthetase family protein